MTVVWNEDNVGVFSWPQCQEEEHNETRLLLRQNLEKLVKGSWTSLKENYTWRPSLSHPHMYNNFKVTSLRINLGRSSKDAKKLVSTFGREFSDVISSPSRNLHIYARLDEKGLSAGVGLPAEAWWDFQKLTEEGEASATTMFDFLKKTIPEGVIETPSWVSKEEINDLVLENWHALIKSLKPGECRFEINVNYGFGEQVEEFLTDLSGKLNLVFQAIKWPTNPKNQQSVI